jgi:uncharacterized protein YjbI with pentapeptide repeats
MEIRKPILDKKSLKTGVFEESSLTDLDGVLVEGGVLEIKNVPEIKIASSVLNAVSFQSLLVEEMSAIDAFLTGANFAGATINWIYLERVVISKSRLQGSQFMNCIAREVLIEKSKCGDSSFRYAKMKNVIFQDCDLENTDFLGAEMENVDFKNCSLKNSQFSHSKLKNVRFKESDIEGIAIDKDSFGEITVNTGQAIYLASRLGLNIED